MAMAYLMLEELRLKKMVISASELRRRILGPKWLNCIASGVDLGWKGMQGFTRKETF